MHSRGDIPTQACNGIEALEIISEQEFDAVLLDIMMPELDGLSVCRAIRRSSDVPVIFLTALSDEDLAEHTRITPDRQHLSLCEKANGECEYLSTDSQGLPACLIEKAKPRQCREFPEKWNFPGWQSKCAGRYEKIPDPQS